MAIGEEGQSSDPRSQRDAALRALPLRGIEISPQKAKTDGDCFVTLAMTIPAGGTSMQYDLLLTDGDVFDPAAGLKGRLDVGIAGGKIVAVGPDLPRNQARRTISAKGRLVTPGLVDIHAHVFVNAHDMGGHTDHFCRQSGHDAV
jgi:hypothetical protein